MWIYILIVITPLVVDKGEKLWNKLHIQSQENIYISHNLQGVGAYCVRRTTGHTTCISAVVALVVAGWVWSDELSGQMSNLCQATCQTYVSGVMVDKTTWLIISSWSIIYRIYAVQNRTVSMATDLQLTGSNAECGVQVVHTYVPVLSSSIIWRQPKPKGSDALQLGK